MARIKNHPSDAQSLSRLRSQHEWSDSALIKLGKQRDRSIYPPNFTMRQEKCGAEEAPGIKAPSGTRVMGLGQKQYLATRDSSLRLREAKKKTPQ
jgi:hypothetical protein